MASDDVICGEGLRKGGEDKIGKRWLGKAKGGWGKTGSKKNFQKVGDERKHVEHIQNARQHGRWRLEECRQGDTLERHEQR